MKNKRVLRKKDVQEQKEAWYLTTENSSDQGNNEENAEIKMDTHTSQILVGKQDYDQASQVNMTKAITFFFFKCMQLFMTVCTILMYENASLSKNTHRRKHI